MANPLQHTEGTAATQLVEQSSGPALPLRRRPVDLVFLGFFLVNICFITYVVDIEQIIIPDPAHFQYPLWPPAPLVDLVHWWGATYDPLLLARPPWWKATIWIDALFFGPFYAVALYAYSKGKHWIRIPSIIWASVLMTNVIIILSEEFFGPHATPHPVVVFLANLPWLLFPVVVIARMARSERPFSAGG